MKDIISTLIEAIMDSLKKHGFLITSLAIIGLLIFLTVTVLAWQSPEIIRAWQGR